MKSTNGGIKISYRFSIIVPAYNVEKYIVDSLDSLTNQTFQDFEVIIVNDGSSDSTQKIIDEYCTKQENFKSITQKNQGVAAARNTALKLVNGEYIGFLDPDGDLFNENAFYHINETINFYKSQDEVPDLIIGPQTTVDTWSKRSYKNAKILSNLDDISPHDHRILWTTLILNKIFRTEKILENNITMPLLSHSSDVGFLFSFLYKCDKIVGCPHDFLIYKKRLFSDESSLSQDSNLNSLNAYYESYKIILNSFEEYSKKYKQFLQKNKKTKELDEFQVQYPEYLNILRYKEAKVLFLNMTYRLFWKCDSNTLKLLKKFIEEFKDLIFPSTWKKLINKNKDLDINDLIIDHKIMADSPIFTLVLDNLIDENSSKLNIRSLKRIISNIYNSQFPSFELIISKELFEILDNDIISKENIHYINYNSKDDFKNEAIKLSKGDYLLFIDEDILFSPILFKKMFDKINNTELDWIIDPLIPIEEDKISSNDSYNIDNFSKREFINNNQEYDGLISDKLIKKSFIIENNFNFSKNIFHDINKLYEIGNFKKINLKYILSSDNYLKDPFISIIIDNMDINPDEINDLFESIYNQNFNSFNIFLNEDLKSKVNQEYLEKSNLKILKNHSFKEIAIKESKAKYAIFIDFPVIYQQNTFKKMFDKFENSKNRYTFVSSPIYQYRYIHGKKNNLKKIDRMKEIRYFSSQELIYSYKDIHHDSSRSKFMVFDLYLPNKMIKLEDLKKNQIFFHDNNYYEDILKLYTKSEFFKFNQKLVLTNILEKKMFKSSFKGSKIPLSINLVFKFHKLIFMPLMIRRTLKNGGR